MKIISLLNEDNVLPNLNVSDKKEALERVISSLSSQVSDEELQAIRDAVFEREEIMSTGVGKGLAIPHGKTAAIDDNYAAFALLKEGIEYQAIDGEPVRMIFLLVGPQSSNRMHIKMLSRISRLMNNSAFTKKLVKADSSKKIIELFKQEEEAHFGG
ncbi:MAG: PTS sugar transporter subunit IIA [Balneolaceae bacterium]|nr:PTS sugar transporter subunit IIA [Balneolaceae bacterium]